MNCLRCGRLWSEHTTAGCCKPTWQAIPYQRDHAEDWLTDNVKLRAVIVKLTRERDEAQGEVKQRTAELRTAIEIGRRVRAERDEARERIPFPYCVECGGEIQRVDEDGCCVSCGTVPVEPDASHVARVKVLESLLSTLRTHIDHGGTDRRLMIDAIDAALKEVE